MQPTPNAPSPADPPVSDLRARILLAAIDLFATHGYGATSIRAIVEAVGCTKPALYYHFGSKAALFIEVHRTVQQQVKEAFAAMPRGSEPIATRLQRFVAGLLVSTAQDPAPARLLLTATHHPEQGQPTIDLEAFHTANVDYLADVLRQGQKEGSIRTDLAAEAMSEILLGMVQNLALELLRGKVPPPNVAQQIIDVFINGARS